MTSPDYWTTSASLLCHVHSAEHASDCSKQHNKADEDVVIVNNDSRCKDVKNDSSMGQIKSNATADVSVRTPNKE